MQNGEVIGDYKLYVEFYFKGNYSITIIPFNTKAAADEAYKKLKGDYNTNRKVLKLY